MIDRDGLPDTPDWVLPDRCDVFETTQPVIPEWIVLGEN